MSTEISELRENPYLLQEFSKRPMLNFTSKTGQNNFCAIDIGYHGVKIATEEGLSFIPNVVCPAKSIGNYTNQDDKRIVFKSGREEFFIGDMALLWSDEGDIRSNERYDLDFIKTSEFIALFLSSVYLVTKGNTEPLIATGLPAVAFETERHYLDKLRDILVGEHTFEIAVGEDVGSIINYRTVTLNIKDENLWIFPQPVGTLASQSMTVEDGELQVINDILLQQSDNKRRTIVDFGFFTIDVYTTVRGGSVASQSFSLKGKGMIYPYTQIKEEIQNITRDPDLEHNGRIIPLWQLSSEIETNGNIIIDGGLEEHDITDMVEATYNRYGLEIGKHLYGKDGLNKAFNIQEIYITGGPTNVVAEPLKEIFKNSKKLKFASCDVNGNKIEPRYFNVLGYFYILLIEHISIMEDKDKIAVTIEE